MTPSASKHRGGGYGSPLERDPDLVLRDVVGGKVSHQRAVDLYGVVINASTNEIDELATRAKRSELARSGDSN